MGIFSIFFKKKEMEPNDVHSISRKIHELTNEKPSKNRSAFDIKIDIERMYEKLSKILFEAVKVRNLKVISSALVNSFIDIKELVNEKGHNIIEHSLFTDDNELFKYLYDNLYMFLSPYFVSIPNLFTIILNRKNTDLLKFFLEHDELASALKKENIATCLFFALQNDEKDLSDLIVNNFSRKLDSRNIEASMIYSIFHNQKHELKRLFSYPDLIRKFSRDNVEKVLAFSVLNQNVEALEIMVDNKYFIRAIEKSSPNVVKNILRIAYNNGSVPIINTIMNNNVLKDNVKDILKIENR